MHRRNEEGGARGRDEVGERDGRKKKRGEKDERRRMRRKGRGGKYEVGNEEGIRKQR